jgi:hypothetical protein
VISLLGISYDYENHEKNKGIREDRKKYCEGKKLSLIRPNFSVMRWQWEKYPVLLE